MPKPITQYNIFLASPGDLSEERILIEDVINELNLTFGNQNDIQLQLLKWETHSVPAISKNHVQGLINDDIGDDYDLFIGLLWKRFGTPTNKADSGTEEEFLRAFERFLSDPKSLQILFYFKNAPITPDVNLEQLGKVQKFKSDISKKKNILFGEYLNGDQLSSFLRIHIPNHILKLHKSQNEKRIVEKQQTEVLIPEIIYQEEYGLIDYQDQFEDSIEESNQSINRIVESINWIGDQFSKKTTEINALMADDKQPPGRKAVRSLMVRMSKSMVTFGSRIEIETPIFFDNFELAINSMQKMLELYRTDFDVDINEVEETKEALIQLIDIMNETIPSTEEFIRSIDNLPRMSKEINAAKSDVKNKIDKLLKNMNVSISIASDLLDSFGKFLDSK